MSHTGGSNPVRLMPLRIVQHLFFCTEVIGSIGRNRICAPELVGHRLGRLPPPRLHILRHMNRQPIQMLLATVLLRLAKPVLVLFTEIGTEHTQPHIVIQSLPRPDGRRMILVPDRLVAVPTGLRQRRTREIRGSEDPVSSIKKLGRFQNHLHHMLITMPTRTARWFVG